MIFDFSAFDSTFAVLFFYAPSCRYARGHSIGYGME